MHGICRKYLLGHEGKIRPNKNGVLWSQTCMRIEMFFGHLVIGNWKFVIGNL